MPPQGPKATWLPPMMTLWAGLRARHVKVAGAVLIVAILCATSLLATVLHETGHATVGAVLGFRVHQVSIGSGRTIARMKLAGTEIRIRSRLLGGGFS